MTDQVNADWTELQVTIPAADTDRAGDIAQMVVPYGIYIEDYSHLEEEAMEIAHIDLIDEDLLKKDRTKSIIHVYISPEENPAEAAVHFSRFVKSEKVVSFCAALHNVHSDPLAVLHAEFCGHRFFSVPREIVPPNVATAFSVVQARLKACNVLLQTCERNAKQTFDIAHLVDRHFV